MLVRRWPLWTGAHGEKEGRAAMLVKVTLVAAIFAIVYWVESI